MTKRNIQLWLACRSQKGTALVTVLMLITIMTILSAATTFIVLGSQKQTSVQFMREGQASNVARAGLQASLSWFKSQLNQPVKQSALTPDDDCSIHAAFYPREHPTELEKGDTLDESIGLIKELKIQEPNIYGRYTVKRYDCGQTDTSEWNKRAVRDITFKRGKQDGNVVAGQGVIWYLESEGKLYIKNDPTKSPEESPNKVLQTTHASVEINRVSMSLYGKPLLTLTGNTASSFNNRCEMIGDTEITHGVVRNNGTPNFTGTPLWTIGGAEQNYVINTGGGESNKDVLNTFNMSLTELKAVSDKIFSNVNEISATDPIPFGVTFLEGNGTNTFTFNNTRPLKGSGVLFVNGNLTLEDDSNSAFSGLIYVTGTINMGASNSLGGAITAGRMVCTPGTRTTLEYNDNVINNVRQRLGLYRQNNLTVNIFK